MVAAHVTEWRFTFCGKIIDKKPRLFLVTKLDHERCVVIAFVQTICSNKPKR